jgi:hypothetical protein
MFLMTLILPTLMPAQAQTGATTFANLNVDNFYRAKPRTSITVTMNGSLNPTGTFQRVTAAGAVSISASNIMTKPAGSLLILKNVGSNTITITETAHFVSAGNIALGAGDTVTAISDGSNWTQIAASNN